MSGEKVMLCPNCWISNAVIQVRKEGYDNDEDRPDDVMDQVSDVCHTTNVKPSKENGGSQEGTDCTKRPLPDSVEDVIVTKKAA